MPSTTIYFEPCELLEMLDSHEDEVAEWLRDGGNYIVTTSASDVINDRENDDLVTDRAKELGMVWSQE